MSNHKIENIVCETKKTNDVQYKVATPARLSPLIILPQSAFINEMRTRGYKVYSYPERYGGSPGEWLPKLSQPVDMSTFHLLTSDVSPTKWIPYEDLWFKLDLAQD